jgi:hypothetical protein
VSREGTRPSTLALWGQRFAALLALIVLAIVVYALLGSVL